MPAPTFPAVPPTTQFANSTRFKLVAPSTSTTLRGGKTFGRGVGQGGWIVNLATFPLYLDTLGKWQAVLNSLRGAVNSILLYNPRRRVLFAYRTTDMQGLIKFGGGAFTGAAALVSITNVRTIVANDFPVGLIIKMGDLFGMVQSGRYSLHRVSQDATTDGAGAVTLYFEPPLSPIFTAGAVLNVRDAQGEFLVDEDSITGDDESASPHPLQFTAMSRLF